MKPLSPLDNAFIMLERREQPLHVGALCVFRPPPGAPEDFAYQLAERLRSSSQAVPPFNRRLVRRGGLNFWEEAEDFDLAQHFVHLALPRPGRMRELLAMISRVHAAHLDRAYPLWRMYLIEGLEDGRIALYAKIHHALVDGVAGIRLLMKTMAADPEASLHIPAPWAAYIPRGGKRSLPVPSPALRSYEALRAVTREGLTRSAGPVIRRLLETQRDRRNGHPDCIGGMQAPMTLLNRRITGSRRFAAQSYSTPRIKAIARRFDATTNDVVLAMCGSALRKYLASHDALPQDPLIAAVPVSTRKDDGTSGNEVAFALTHLGTHIADPEHRLRAIKACMDYNKQALKALNPGQLLAYEGMLFAPGAIRLFAGIGGNRGIVNVVISNVPGPSEDLYWQGCRLEGVYPVSVVIHRIALNITLVKRHDFIDFGLIGCRKTVPSLQRLLDYLAEAVDELDGLGVDSASAPAPAAEVIEAADTAETVAAP